MDLQRFHELCSAYGAVRRRWPESERAIFDRFADSDSGMRALADAAQVDALLDEWRDAADDSTRAARIVADACRSTHPRLAVGWIATAFAACVVLGFALGFMQAAELNTQSELYAELMIDNGMLENLP
jgi:hypothetical protein